jgi:hypothetical protein
MGPSRASSAPGTGGSAPPNTRADCGKELRRLTPQTPNANKDPRIILL